MTSMLDALKKISRKAGQPAEPQNVPPPSKPTQEDASAPPASQDPAESRQTADDALCPEPIEVAPAAAEDSEVWQDETVVLPNECAADIAVAGHGVDINISPAQPGPPADEFNENVELAEQALEQATSEFDGPSATDGGSEFEEHPKIEQPATVDEAPEIEGPLSTESDPSDAIASAQDFIDLVDELMEESEVDCDSATSPDENVFSETSDEIAAEMQDLGDDEQDFEDHPEIGDLPRLYLNSPMENMELRGPQTQPFSDPPDRSFADQMNTIGPDGVVEPPAPTPPSPAPARPTPAPLAQVSSPSTPAPTTPLQPAQPLPVVSEAAQPSQFEVAVSEALDKAALSMETERDWTDREKTDLTEQVDTTTTTSAGDPTTETVSDAKFPIGVAGEEIVAADEFVTSEMESAADQPANQYDESRSSQATSDDEQSFGPSADVGVKARPTVGKIDDVEPQGSEVLSEIDIPPTIQPAVAPRKSNDSRTPTLFEAEVRKLIFDPIVGTQIAEMFERISDDCPGHGALAMLSAHVESHVSEMVSCMALVHALGNKKNVLLVDGNAEKGSITDGFGLHKMAGFSDACSGRVHWKSVVQPSATARLSLMPSGAPLDELANRAPVISILGEMAEDYDLVIVDAGRADSQFALPVCHASDRTYLLVRLGKTPRDLASNCVEHLNANGVNLNGVIVTNVPEKEAA